MKTLEQVRREGFEALLKQLGPVDTVRFLQQYEFGQGDYTAERGAWLQTLDKDGFVARVKARQVQVEQANRCSVDE
jgi:hypothetical protein